MAGEAKTNAFMLATATVMIGPQPDLFNLTVADHSIGLVKNFQVSSEPSYVELTQGVKNQLVYSVMNGNEVRASMEVFEYTSKNLMYGTGLDGSNMSPLGTPLPLKTAITTGGTSVAFAAGTDVSAEYPAGTWIYVQDGTSDRVHVGRVASAAYETDTLTVTLTAETAMPADFTAAVVTGKGGKVNHIPVGKKDEQPFFGAKVVGILPEGSRPVVILFPKIRIIRGFTVAFSSENFGNLPFEFQPFELTGADPHASIFGNDGYCSLFSST